MQLLWMKKGPRVYKNYMATLPRLAHSAAEKCGQRIFLFQVSLYSMIEGPNFELYRILIV